MALNDSSVCAICIYKDVENNRGQVTEECKPCYECAMSDERESFMLDEARFAANPAPEAEERK